MADLPTVFSESAATRIGAATRWAELQQGIPQDGYGSSPGNGLCLVRTRTTLPAGYTGAMAALGDVIEKQPDGTVNTLGRVWIKDQNGGTLSANTIYQARVGGTFAQNITTNGITAPTTLGLYLVQKGSSPVVFEPFKVSAVSGASTYVQSLDQIKTAIIPIYNPTYAYFGPTWEAIFNQIRPQVFGHGVFPSIGNLIQFYTVNPFTFLAYARYYRSDLSGDFVTCGWTQGSYFFQAFDPLQLVRSVGYGARVIISWGVNNSQDPYTIIAAHKNDAYTTGGIGSGIGSGISGV